MYNIIRFERSKSIFKTDNLKLNVDCLNYNLNLIAFFSSVL